MLTFSSRSEFIYYFFICDALIATEELGQVITTIRRGRNFDRAI